MSVLIAYAVPVFLITLAIEWWIVRSRFRETRGYEARDTWASLSMGLGNVAINGASAE